MGKVFINGEKYNFILNNIEIVGFFTDSHGKFKDIINNGILHIEIKTIDNDGKFINLNKIKYEYLNEIKNYITNMANYNLVSGKKEPHTLVYSNPECTGFNVLNVKVEKAEKIFNHIVEYFKIKNI